MGVLSTNSNVFAGCPIEAQSSSAMAAYLTQSFIGRILLYTGTTNSDYVNGRLYIVEADDD